MIPSKMPADLSAEARTLLRAAHRGDGFPPKITDDQIPAAREIAEAHLGRLRLDSQYGHSLSVTRLAKNFTVAEGPTDRGFYVEVEVLRHADDRSGILLACLTGAKYQRQDSSRAPWQQWRLTAMHPTATDGEHDPAYLADFRIEHPTVTDLHPGETVLVGILSQVLLWPLGTDITLLDDQRPEVRLTEPEMCTMDSCIQHRGSHPFAPYLPPERRELDVYQGRTVRITLRPQTGVDAHGLPTGTTTITERGDDA